MGKRIRNKNRIAALKMTVVLGCLRKTNNLQVGEHRLQDDFNICSLGDGGIGELRER